MRLRSPCLEVIRPGPTQYFRYGRSDQSVRVVPRFSVHECDMFLVAPCAPR